LLGLTEYFAFYNDERPHQALGYRTPAAVHRSGEGGGAGIAVHSSSAVGPAPLRSAGAGPTAEQGQRQDAACDLTGTA